MTIDTRKNPSSEIGCTVAESSRRSALARDLRRGCLVACGPLASARGVLPRQDCQLAVPPAWVNDVGASPVDLYLPARVRDLPRTRALIFQQTPEPLKKRHVYTNGFAIQVP